VNVEYVVLADAMNFGPDGKINLLGMGWRQLNLGQLPANVSFSIVVSLIGTRSDAGEYEADFCLVLPDDTEELLTRGPVVLAGPPEADVLGVVLGLDLVGKPFIRPGRYAVRIKVGTALGEYQFQVNAPDASLEAPKAPTPRRRRAAAATR
jgi:hypothetical protein